VGTHLGGGLADGHVPTATFRILYVFLVLAHNRRRVLHFNVTDGPGAQWTAQQMVEAFPEDTAPKYMIRDRDGIYGDYFRRRVQGLGIEQVVTAPRSPLGRIHMSSGLWDPYGESASITSSFSVSAISRKF
jgi:hypothetical protein